MWWATKASSDSIRRSLTVRPSRRWTEPRVPPFSAGNRLGTSEKGLKTRSTGTYKTELNQMSVIEIKDGELVLARHIPAEAAWKDGLSFFSSDNEYIQVGLWGYPAGK